MNLLKQLSLTFRLIKFRRFFGSLVYPLKRDLLERKYRSAQPLEIYEPSGNIIKSEAIARGGYFYFERLGLEIYFLTPDLVRIDWKPNTPPIPYGIVRQDWEEVETTFEEKSDRWEIASSTLKIIVYNDGAIAYQNAQGKTLRQEFPPQRRTEKTSQMSISGWLHQAQLIPILYEVALNKALVM